jgi:hypothetical protein
MKLFLANFKVKEEQKPKPPKAKNQSKKAK